MHLDRSVLGVEMSRSCRFSPYPIVLVPIQVTAPKQATERFAAEQHDRAAWLNDVPDALPHGRKRDNRIPSASRGA